MCEGLRAGRGNAGMCGRVPALHRELPHDGGLIVDRGGFGPGGVRIGANGLPVGRSALREACLHKANLDNKANGTSKPLHTMSALRPYASFRTTTAFLESEEI